MRTLPLKEFFLGPKRNALAEDELVLAVRIDPSGQAQTFMKVGPRNAMVIAVCSLAVLADRERGELRAAYGSAGPVPALVTAPLDARADFPDLVADAASPIDDVRGTAAYRRHALRVLTKRALDAGAGVKIRLVVNGEAREADVWAGESLLTTLRDTLDLPGSKNACEQGECGSCSVLLDGELVCSCLVLAAQADGHEVTTVEGLRSPEGLHTVQQAFIDDGRRPVRLLHARARRRDRRPARARPESERRRDPRGALGEPLPLYRLREDLRRRPAGGPRMTTTQQQQAELQRARVGDRGTRHDATPKVTGEFAYSSDLHAAGMLWGVTVRSPHAHARILELDISAALGMAGVHAVLTHADVPGQKTYGLEFADQPVLAADRVRYYGEPVALVAAEEPEQARRAAAAVRVEYEVLEAVTDMERATEQPPTPSGAPDDGPRLPRRPTAERRPPHDHPSRRSRRRG